VESVVNTDYSAPAPNGAIPYLLTAGRLVVLFDGLDELLDTSYRQEITADIETFAARFVAAPILVTSRRVGYEQAPLDPRRFEIARLNELDENQVEQYSRLWFGLRRELKEKERERMASDFVRDSAEAADDLRRNTLMLALLCNIYRGDGYIPRRRPQVYEKCAVMLFERWDRGRRIVAPLEFERHLRPAMQHLAYWIYADPSLRGGVTEAALVRSATQFLTERRFEDEDDARQEARKFVEYCRGRAWVFTDTGTTPDGERLYQFTHRTFLEFFAAEHLVRTNRTPADLASLLRPHVHAGEWDVVAQLAFQLQDDNIDGAADDLLIDLLTHAAGEHRDVTLSFAARALSFLVPRRQTCREVAKAVTRRTCEWLASDTADARSPSSMPAETHVALVNADRENLHPVSQALVDEAVSFLVENPNVAAADAALEVACNTDMAMAGRTSNEPRESWDPARITAFEAMWPTLTNYTAASERVAYDAFFFGAIDLDAVARLHSAEALFESRSFRIYGNYIRSAIVDLFLSGQLGQRTRPGGLAIGTREELGSLGRTLLALQPPWSVQEGIHSGLYHQFAGTVQPRDDILEGSELFGAFATLAFTTERAQNAGDINDTLAGLERGGGWLALLNPWIRRRYVDDEVSPSEVPTLPVDGATADAISRWSEGQWSAMSQSPATELRDLP
jgi:hypothetical protein